MPWYHGFYNPGKRSTARLLGAPNNFSSISFKFKQPFCDKENRGRGERIKVQLYLGEAFMPCKYLKGNKNVAKYSFIHEFEIFSPFIPYSLFYVCSFVSKEMCLKKTLNTSQYISHFIYPDT